MTLPLVSAVAGGRAGRRAAGAGLLLLIVIAGSRGRMGRRTTRPLFGNGQGRRHCRQCRRGAYHGAHRRAASRPRRRDPAADGLDRSCQSCQSSTTRRSPTWSTTSRWRTRRCRRYATWPTIPFTSAGSRIRQLLRSAGIAFSENPGKPVVVVPVFQDGDKLVLWDDPNPWREAWGQAPAASGPAKLSLPLGGVGDLTAIDAEQARSGDAQALTDIAQRNGGDEALVALATERRQGGRVRRARSSASSATGSGSRPTAAPTISMPIRARATAISSNGPSVLVIADIEHGGPPPATRRRASPPPCRSPVLATGSRCGGGWPLYRVSIKSTSSR